MAKAESRKQKAEAPWLGNVLADAQRAKARWPKWAKPQAHPRFTPFGEKASDERLFYWRPAPLPERLLPAARAQKLLAEARRCAKNAKLCRAIKFPRGAEIWSARAQALRWSAGGL